MRLFQPRNTEVWDPSVPVTSENGPLDRGDQLRQIAALYSDGRLLVSKSHTNNPQVLSLIAEARLSDIGELKIEPVDINRVQLCYERTDEFGGSRSRHDEARMRREVLTLVGDLAKKRASDIHVVVGEQSCTVRARIDGLMTHVAEWPPEFGHNFCAAAFTMADAADVNYQPYEYQGARVSNRKDLQLPEGVISLRLQFNPTTFGGRAMIIRLLYTADERTSSDIMGLGFTPEQLEDFETLRTKPFGINIVAGPTGHGKSTTLQRNIISILQEHHYNIAIYTVEDPPEYPIPGAVQMPVVNASSAQARGEEFTKAISASLRSNPDRIMIGEVRDAASAQLAFEAAMTGHQVWTTLHSNDAMTITFRLRDLAVENYKLGDPSLLTGLISQRLVRLICPKCCLQTREEDLGFGILARLETAEVPIHKVRRRNPKGCEHCGYGSGYIGRTVVAEIIMPDNQFLEYVQQNRKVDAEKYWLAQLGGRNMVEHAIDRIITGEIDPVDAERVIGLLNLPMRESIRG